MKKKLFSSLAAVLGLCLVFSVSVFANQDESDSNNSTENVVAAAVPTCIFTVPNGPLTAGQRYDFKVGTTSTNGPHVFYFTPGDGTSRQRYDGRGGEQNRIFYHSYPGYQYQKSYTASAQTQDQLNISRVVSKSIIVKAW
ncbi:hypothetical protein NST02_05170 [Robertmurraya sp. FSL W8-0741]|uniref:hypothetical protein n=1 Tax=Robertmurraya TaxID=2837507 RepID=UPI0010F9F0DD|nr:hypothetical protein [Robertmurraya siralis]